MSDQKQKQKSKSNAKGGADRRPSFKKKGKKEERKVSLFAMRGNVVSIGSMITVQNVNSARICTAAMPPAVKFGRTIKEPIPYMNKDVRLINRHLVHRGDEHKLVHFITVHSPCNREKYLTLFLTGEGPYEPSAMFPTIQHPREFMPKGKKYNRNYLKELSVTTGVKFQIGMRPAFQIANADKVSANNLDDLINIGEAELFHAQKMKWIPQDLFTAFYDYFANLPDVAEIVESQSTVTIPEEPKTWAEFSKEDREKRTNAKRKAIPAEPKKPWEHRRERTRVRARLGMGSDEEVTKEAYELYLQMEAEAKSRGVDLPEAAADLSEAMGSLK